jgi:hypothetical protein
MSTAGRLLGAVLAATVLMTPGLASAQASASPAAAPAASYGSYLSAPAQDNRMLRSRHVAVELAKLQPTDKGPSTLRLEADGRELAGMAAYHQVGDRWERVP